MDKESKNRAKNTVILISSREYDAVIYPIIPRVISIHIRTIRIRITELKEIAIGSRIILFRIIHIYTSINTVVQHRLMRLIFRTLRVSCYNTRTNTKQAEIMGNTMLTPYYMTIVSIS
jgi:hypothetical protein